jgi:diguanylate cyclase (GGDEF)-like protein
MPLRPRTATTSLRPRLVLALVLVLIAPLITAWVLAGVLAPRSARTAAERSADRDAGSVTLALAARCDAIANAAKATAIEVQAYATEYGSLSARAALTAVRKAVGHQPAAAVAVFDQQSRLLASGGAPAGLGPARAAGYGASCAQQRAGSNPLVAGLAATVPVRTFAAGQVAVVVFWLLDDATLRALRAGLGTEGQLSLLGAGLGIGISSDGVLASTTNPASSDPAAARSLRAAVQAVTGGAVAGAVNGMGYAVRPAGPGVPFRVLASYPVRGAGWLHPLGLIALLVVGLALLPLRAIAGRLARPVDAELRFAAGELRSSQGALADTFNSFGEALQNTHNLEKLLDVVAGACLHGTGAVAGIALLIEDPAGDPDDRPTPTPRLQARGSAWAESPAAKQAVAELPRFADRYFKGLDPAAPLPLFAQLTGAGSAVAVSILADGRAIGVLALARGENAGGFDTLALPRICALADRAGTAVQNIRLHEEARRQSVTDPLTGVGNVRQLTSTLFREIERATRFERPLTVLMLDLDHFKEVNDTLGHGFGDLVLREFAHRLTACVREVDVVTRYGGEEFAVVLPETDLEGAGRLAERVLNAVRSAPFRHGELQCSVTVSIGVAAFPRNARSGEEVLEAADEALYAAKRGGRDCWRAAEISPAASAVSQAG